MGAAGGAVEDGVVEQGGLPASMEIQIQVEDGTGTGTGTVIATCVLAVLPDDHASRPWLEALRRGTDA